jgi:hypothetical protein
MEGITMRAREMSIKGRAIHRENQILAGTDYELSVYAAPGGLYGAFQCSDCGYIGTSTLMSSTQHDALTHARHNAESHHRQLHGTPGA